MAEVGLSKFSMPRLFLLTGLLFCLISCSTMETMEIKREVQIPKEFKEGAGPGVTATPVKTPDFIPVHEDISPLKTRIIDISARNTPLRDVLSIISEATGLNLVMEREIAPETPVTVSLKNVTAEEALNRVCSSVDYFYTVKDNMLFIKATETRSYELGQPPMVQSYHTDLGGDMLGGAMSASAGSTSVKGNISQKTETDKTAYNFWDALEKSIEKIVGTAAGTQSTVQQTFVVNRLTGSVIVTATKKTLEKVESYINTIKNVMNRQVLVEAKIIEVTLSDGLKFGINWSYVLNTRDGQSTTFATQKFADVAQPTSASPNFSITTVASDFTSLLRAIQTQGETRILSNPRISIMNGQTSILSVGQDTNYISQIQTTTTTSTPPVTTFTVNTSTLLSGIMIGIVPFISENGDVSMSITPITSDLVTLLSQNLGTPDSSGNFPFLIQLPTTNLRQLSTTVKVRNGQTVIIGGLITNREDVQDSKIPFLGDVPILGYFFKSRVKAVIRTELVVLIQPTIISR
jgi:MSHA type pilus biogenesis protein MshL